MALCLCTRALTCENFCQECVCRAWAGKCARESRASELRALVARRHRACKKKPASSRRSRWPAPPQDAPEDARSSQRSGRCIYIRIRIYIPTNIHTYIRIYIHTYPHTCIHTYIHTCIRASTGKQRASHTTPASSSSHLMRATLACVHIRRDIWERQAHANSLPYLRSSRHLPENARSTGYQPE